MIINFSLSVSTTKQSQSSPRVDMSDVGGRLKLIIYNFQTISVENTGRSFPYNYNNKQTQTVSKLSLYTTEKRQTDQTKYKGEIYLTVKDSVSLVQE